MPIDLTTAMYLVAAVLVAAVIRFMDTPKTELIVTNPDGTIAILWGNIIPTLVGIGIAVPLGAWVLALNVLDPKGFLEIVAVGILGLASVKALINQVYPKPAAE